MIEYKFVKLPANEQSKKRIVRKLGNDYVSFFGLWSGMVKNPNEKIEITTYQQKKTLMKKEDLIIDNLGKLGDLPNSNISFDIIEIFRNVFKCFMTIAKSPHYSAEKFGLTEEHLVWISPMKEILRGAKNE